MTTQERVYLDAQAACGLKSGDWVRITREPERDEAGWHSANGYDISDMVGKVYQVDTISKFGIAVKRDDPNFVSYFPYFVLEKAEKPAPKFKPFEKVLVRDNDNLRWWPNIYASFQEGEGYVHATIDGTIYKQCIPYEGNEHLTGTTEQRHDQL